MRTSKRPLHAHHIAYMCYDTEKTIDFYCNFLNMKLVAHFEADRVPSTGDPFPYFHTFFEMENGDIIAFFEVPDIKKPEPRGAIDSVFQHLAMALETEEELLMWKDRLEARGIDVVGPTDHHYFKSIYFFDPNGLRLEFAVQVKAYTEEDSRNALEAAQAWTARTKALASA
jgi:glyoxylase I family protein